MSHDKTEIVNLLGILDLGSSVAEDDNLLESARVETSVLADLVNDRVDLVPGTKGSGKSALYRLIVEFLASFLLTRRQVVVAHGVESHGDDVFMAFHDQFEELSERDFVDFWCIYLVSLAHEQFVKGDQYQHLLVGHEAELGAFREACAAARIPEIRGRRTMRDVLEWVLNAVQRLRPRAAVAAPDGTRLELGIFGDPVSPPERPAAADEEAVPRNIGRVKAALEQILQATDLTLWLMVDRLDEVFPRRSALETRALRGLLRTTRVFKSERIRVKVFLRDDILDQVTFGNEGFTALSHIASRQAETLRWSEDQILTLIVKRLFASQQMLDYFEMDVQRLQASRDYRHEAFYRMFPATVHSPPNQSPTLKWIYSHTRDGNGVVTPRDVIYLLTKAKQWQQNEFREDPLGTTEWVIGGAAIRYGLSELSRHKRATVLRAEFPHLWPYIERFEHGKTEYTEQALRRLVGSDDVIRDLVSIGLIETSTSGGTTTYKVPFLYRDGLDLTQGRQN